MSRAELIDGFRDIYGDAVEEEVNKIFDRIDFDGNGQIDYSEWVIATIDKERLLSKEKLEIAFSLFDKDGDGSIKAEEVKELLCAGREIDDQVWKDIVRQVDSDDNGVIDFEEFSSMLKKLLDD